MVHTVDKIVPGEGSALDRVSERVQGGIAGATKRGPLSAVVSALSGERWLGHPLHPAVVILPAGAWIVSAIYDAKSARSKSSTDEKVADDTLKIGLVTAGPAALTGVAQFLRTTGQARRVAGVHWALNATAVILYAASAALRSAGSRKAGRRLALVALSLVGPGAYLGGHLAYRLGVGVDVEPG